MGQADEAVACTPLWFTDLAAAPRALSWAPPAGAGRWHVRLRTAERGDLLQADVDRPRLALSAAVRQGLPRGAHVRWAVWPAGADASRDRPLLRAVFRLLPPAEGRLAAQRRGAARAIPAGFRRDLAVAECLFAAGLYDALDRELRAAGARYPATGPETFALRRFHGALFRAVYQRANRPGLGMEREVHWAAARARDHVRASYEALGLPPSSFPG
jgi:hypothetical protein